jgi:hypothetical protein
LGEKEGERAEGPALLFDDRPFYFGIVGEVKSFFRPASQAFCDESDGRRFARSSQGHDHKVASLAAPWTGSFPVPLSGLVHGPGIAALIVFHADPHKS